MLRRTIITTGTSLTIIMAGITIAIIHPFTMIGGSGMCIQSVLIIIITRTTFGTAMAQGQTQITGRNLDTTTGKRHMEDIVSYLAGITTAVSKNQAFVQEARIIRQAEEERQGPEEIRRRTVHIQGEDAKPDCF